MALTQLTSMFAPLHSKLGCRAFLILYLSYPDWIYNTMVSFIWSSRKLDYHINISPPCQSGAFSIFILAGNEAWKTALAMIGGGPEHPEPEKKIA